MRAAQAAQAEGAAASAAVRSVSAARGPGSGVHAGLQCCAALQAISRQPLALSRQPSAIRRQPSTVNRQPPIGSHQPSAIRCQPSDVSRQTPVVKRQPSATVSDNESGGLRPAAYAGSGAGARLRRLLGIQVQPLQPSVRAASGRGLHFAARCEAGHRCAPQIKTPPMSEPWRPYV